MAGNYRSGGNGIGSAVKGLVGAKRNVEASKQMIKKRAEASTASAKTKTEMRGAQDRATAKYKHDLAMKRAAASKKNITEKGNQSRKTAAYKEKIRVNRKKTTTQKGKK